MTGTDEAYDEDEDEALGPSLAIPPLYVIQSADRCPECGRAVRLYMFGSAAYHDAGDRRPVDVFHFLRMTWSVPGKLAKLLKARCPDFYPDTDKHGGRPYLMNHCPCGAKLDDDFVCGDVGAAFWPDTPEGYRQFKLFRLPIDEAIEVESSFMIGGEEYLNFDGAEDW